MRFSDHGHGRYPPLQIGAPCLEAVICQQISRQSMQQPCSLNTVKLFWKRITTLNLTAHSRCWTDMVTVGERARTLLTQGVMLIVSSRCSHLTHRGLSHASTSFQTTSTLFLSQHSQFERRLKVPLPAKLNYIPSSQESADVHPKRRRSN